MSAFEDYSLETIIVSISRHVEIRNEV